MPENRERTSILFRIYYYERQSGQASKKELFELPTSAES